MKSLQFLLALTWVTRVVANGPRGAAERVVWFSHYILEEVFTNRGDWRIAKDCVGTRTGLRGQANRCHLTEFLDHIWAETGSDPNGEKERKPPARDVRIGSHSINTANLSPEEKVRRNAGNMNFMEDLQIRSYERRADLMASQIMGARLPGDQRKLTSAPAENHHQWGKWQEVNIDRVDPIPIPEVDVYGNPVYRWNGKLPGKGYTGLLKSFKLYSGTNVGDGYAAMISQMTEDMPRIMAEVDRESGNLPRAVAKELEVSRRTIPFALDRALVLREKDIATHMSEVQVNVIQDEKKVVDGKKVMKYSIIMRQGETQRLGIEWQVMDREATIAAIPEAERAAVVTKLEAAELKHLESVVHIDHQAVADALDNMNTRARTMC